MSGRKRVTRAEFIRELAERANRVAERYTFRSPNAENRQENVEKPQKIEISDQNSHKNQKVNVRTVIEGHFVDISWWYTQRDIRSLPETPNR